MKILVTGSLGLVGSEAVRFYLDHGNEVVGIDNNMREFFFGEDGSVLRNQITHKYYKYCNADILDCAEIFKSFVPDVIIHCAAQPSHDWSAKDPITDFNINALGTVLLLENCRMYCPEAVFIFVSTNKVYGDNPNKLQFTELKYRYESLLPIDESMPVDNCIHSVFGVSKLAADVMCQEYGKNFGIKTGIFRCGCITGSRHSGAELHGFLSYVVKCKKEGRIYKIYGYKGKQVRDNIHAFDLVSAFDHFVQNPRPGEVYNMGGGIFSNISVLEAMRIFNVPYEYIDKPRVGDHKWYISNVSKFQYDYPKWKYKYNLEAIIEDLVSA
jgi:CDP-paratose 2-epimerase